MYMTVCVCADRQRRACSQHAVEKSRSLNVDQITTYVYLCMHSERAVHLSPAINVCVDTVIPIPCVYAPWGLGLLLGTEAPAMTPNGVSLTFLCAMGMTHSHALNLQVA